MQFQVTVIHDSFIGRFWGRNEFFRQRIRLASFSNYFQNLMSGIKGKSIKNLKELTIYAKKPIIIKNFLEK